MSNLTDRDLSRLMTLKYVHGGELRHIPHGVGESFNAMEQASVVQIERKELEGFGVPILETSATITDKGKRVAEAGMMAMRESLKL